MIQIGRYKFGFAVASTIVVFVVLSICALVAAIQQSRPEWPMPLARIVILNESMAIIATLLYGIFAHVIVTLINKKKHE